MSATVLDQLAIVDVAPASIPEACTPGLWPCGCCGAHGDVERTWVVTYDAAPLGHRQALVCQDCARRLRQRL